MNNNEFLSNNLTIEIQPKQNFHYRYVSELAGNTHGTITGQNEDYPKIKLLLPENGFLDNFGNKRDFFVLCSLHCYDNKILSPHLLMLKKETELNYDLIFEKMSEVYERPNQRVWELKEYVIVRLTAGNYYAALQNKQWQYESLGLPLPFENILGPLNLTDGRRVKESGKLNVCLGFTIFEKDFYTNTYSLYRDTIYSCNIYHGDDLRIHRLCNIKGSVLGGTEVTILIRVESNLPLNIVIRKINELTKDVSWSTVVEIQKSKIFGNAAITFTMPSYKGPATSEDEIEVFMHLRVGNTSYKSNDVKFYYINEKRLKRRREMNYDYGMADGGQNSRTEFNEDYLSFDHVSMTMPPEISLRKLPCEAKTTDLKTKIDEIFKNEQNWPKNSTDFILYDALESTNDFIHLYKTAIVSGRKNLVTEFRNEKGENLLHWACKMNKNQRIRPLIGLGCHIHEQDFMGRTPLHIAIAAKHTECILEIQKLLENHSQYPKEIEENCIKMSKVYNHNGHTVLHEAVLEDLAELCETMLSFLFKHNVNIFNYEVLGSGDSIVHLASSNNLSNMLSLIEKYVPNCKNSENYAGMTLKDVNKNDNKSQEVQGDDEVSDDNSGSGLEQEGVVKKLMTLK